MNFKNYLNKYSVLFLLVFSFVAGTVSQYVRIKDHKENDHWVYFRTAKRIEAQNIKEIYSLKDGALPFRYQPTTMMLFSGMANFDEVSSRKIWLVTQSLFILGSLYLLYLVLIKIESPSPLNSIAFSFFLFYRYFLDALYCGQIAGIFFFSFALALFFFVHGRKNSSNQALLFLFMLKIVPVILVMINFWNSKSWKEFLKLILHLTLVIFAIHGIYFLWFVFKFGTNNIYEFLPTFKSWMNIVLADKDYFDGSTPKSQALRGVILRLFGSSELSETAWKATSLIGFLSLLIFWGKLKMSSLKVKAYAFSLGILAFVLVMPQSLPYQIFLILIPVVFIMSEYLTSFKKTFLLVLFCFSVFCTFATRDLVGFNKAELVQYYSLPFFTFIIIGILIIKEILLIERKRLVVV